MPNRNRLIRRAHRARRAALACLAAVSTLLALVMVFVWLAPDAIRITPTGTLLGILGLLVLPALTIAAWAWDRRIRRLVPDPPKEAVTDSHRA
ncbi:MAG: hypothetical protein AAGB48_07865 [Planctomycetota bacterium]